MAVNIREARQGDESEAGPICYAAFAAIANAHNFAPDFPSPEVATGVIGSMIGDPGAFGVVAERDGKIVGSNFLHEGDSIVGVGPITVDPGVQNEAVGRALMDAVMRRSEEKGRAGVRLVQAGYHCRSLALYSKLGFEIREHLTCMQGPALRVVIPGVAVRKVGESDIAACDALCFAVHGHNRSAELRATVARGGALVTERAGRITGYTTGVSFFGHTVGETNDDVKALIGAADAFLGPGFLVPSRNGDLMRWCFAKGLKMTQPLTLMTRGLYNEPSGAYLPSILY